MDLLNVDFAEVERRVLARLNADLNLIGLPAPRVRKLTEELKQHPPVWRPEYKGQEPPF